MLVLFTANQLLERWLAIGRWKCHHKSNSEDKKSLKKQKITLNVIIRKMPGQYFESNQKVTIFIVTVTVKNVTSYHLRNRFSSRHSRFAFDTHNQKQGTKTHDSKGDLISLQYVHIYIFVIS